MSKQDGRLYLNDSRRLEHVRVDPDGWIAKDYWTSGEGIEINIGGIWLRGRIEYSHERSGYYFISANSKQDVLHHLVDLRARRPAAPARIQFSPSNPQPTSEGVPS